MPEALQFPEQTVIIAKDQPEYLPLPTHVCLDREFSMQRFTFKYKFTQEELAALIAADGVFYPSVLVPFGGNLQPQRFEIEKPACLAQLDVEPADPYPQILL